MLMLPLLRLMAEKQASDLFLTSAAPPQIKIKGVLHPVSDKPLTSENVQHLAYSMLEREDIETFERELELNFARTVEGVGNFRVNVFRQRGHVGVVVRFISPTIPSLDTLALPPSLRELVMIKRGLIIVAGATGSGKSSTVAGLLGQRNATTPGHILTIEDPIEFLYEHQKSIVNQREVGVDTHSYRNALKNAMREAPDVLMIGEVRDGETLTYAINYAQSGHLCITTMHANNSYHLLNRAISFFPPENRSALLMDLSVALKAVISQRLIPTTDGKLTPAVELLVNTQHISDLIRNGEVDKIKEAIESSMSEGSQTFEQALFKLYSEGRISLEHALKNADSPTNLYWLINHAGEKQKTTSERDDRDDGAPSFQDFTLNPH